MPTTLSSGEWTPAAGMTGEDAISIHPYDIYHDLAGFHYGDPLRPNSLFDQHIVNHLEFL